MLINLSNHPYDSWSPEQSLAAIDDYGSVKDVPFPHIPPDASYDEVLDMAVRYFQIVQDHMSPIGGDCVHVMGELVFCHAFVNICYDYGVPCIASTTKRVVQQIGDRKVSHFEFVRFRPYFSTAP